MIPMKYYISTTKFNCGIDLHARQMYVCLMDQQGKKLVHTNIKKSLTEGNKGNEEGRLHHGGTEVTEHKTCDGLFKV